MLPSMKSARTWLLGWLSLSLLGGAVIVRLEIAQRRQDFLTDARIAHRLLSQRVVQHDAILATLALLGPPVDGADGRAARLAAVYPQLLAVLRRDGQQPWSDAALLAGEQQSRASRHAVLGPIDAAGAHYSVVLAGDPSSFALRIDLRRMVPWDTWPMAADGPVRVLLKLGGQVIELQAGAAAGVRPAGLTAGFAFAKTLDSASQPFELQLQRVTGPAEWPWRWLLGWALFSAITLTAAWALLRGAQERRRGLELLRVVRVARLNSLGELAGGMAHELNQPLTALLASTQAAGRLLADDPPALAEARHAMTQAAAQARRAAGVVSRLRRLVEAPDAQPALQPLSLQAAMRGVTELLAPELRRLSIRVELPALDQLVMADPVALEQLMHNLIGNAMQALAEVPTAERRLSLAIDSESGMGVFSVSDSGPGIAADALPRLFEPFFSTRAQGLGLGLGLSLCESLAQRMQGTLSARNAPPRGAQFRLHLPLAKPI